MKNVLMTVFATTFGLFGATMSAQSSGIVPVFQELLGELQPTACIVSFEHDGLASRKFELADRLQTKIYNLVHISCDGKSIRETLGLGNSAKTKEEINDTLGQLRYINREEMFSGLMTVMDSKGLKLSMILDQKVNSFVIGEQLFFEKK